MLMLRQIVSTICLSMLFILNLNFIGFRHRVADILPYKCIFGGVNALTPEQYRTVNGYSNLYWNWGAEDDDFLQRLLLLGSSKLRFQWEGLRTTLYKLISVKQEKLYTHILADVNPAKMELGTKVLMLRLFRLSIGKVIVKEHKGFQFYEFSVGDWRERQRTGCLIHVVNGTF